MDKHLKQKKIDQPCSKKEFPFGTRVSICGSKLDPERFEWKSHPPRFYGVVQNPRHYDEHKGFDTNEDEKLVEFVLAGEYIWVDKTKPNTTQKVGKAQDLNVMNYAPNRCINNLYLTAEDYKKNFFADPGG